VKEALSRKLNVPLVNVAPAITGKSLYLEGDPVHFDAIGIEKIAARLFENVIHLTGE